MKSFFAAAAIALPLVFSSAVATTAPAEAHTNIRIILGVPYYGYQAGPDYRFRNGYGWFRNGRVVNRGNRISCVQAGRIIQNKGYRNIAAKDCQGSTYVFRATRNGNRVQLIVNSRTGAVWRG